MMTTRLGLALLLVAAACGDDDPGGSAPDAGAVADAGGDTPDAAAAGAVAFAVATDYSTAGVASTVTVPGLVLTQNAVDGVASTDPVVRLHGDRIYIVNRFGQDNVTILDAASLELVTQISTGAGSNPQDVAVAGNRVYVATFSGPGVAVLDAADPDAGVVETIDLTALDPGDDEPNCNTLAIAGGHLVVSCGILDAETFQPQDVGQVAVIDLATGEVTDVVALAHPRPLGFGLAVPPGSALEADLLVATVPDFGDPASDGCVESVTVDPADGTGTSACLIDNADLGGYAAALAHDPAADRVWLAVTSGFDSEDFAPLGHLRAFDATAGALGDPVSGPDDRPIDVAVCATGHLVVSEALQGVRVLEPDGAGELTEAPLDLGLPPVTNGLVCL